VTLAGRVRWEHRYRKRCLPQPFNRLPSASIASAAMRLAADPLLDAVIAIGNAYYQAALPVASTGTGSIWTKKLGRQARRLGCEAPFCIHSCIHGRAYAIKAVELRALQPLTPRSRSRQSLDKPVPICQILVQIFPVPIGSRSCHGYQIYLTGRHENLETNDIDFSAATQHMAMKLRSFPQPEAKDASPEHRGKGPRKHP